MRGEKKHAYFNGIILDGSEHMEPQKGMAVLTEDGKITKVATEQEVIQSMDLSGYEMVNLHGSYMMPGLVNLHVHIPASGTPKVKGVDSARLVRIMTRTAGRRAITMGLYQRYAMLNLLSGATTIRTVGGVTNFDSRLRDLIHAGRVQGPRILASNMAVSVPGGHMAGSLAHAAENTEDAVLAVDRIAKDDPNLIKLMVTGGVLDADEKGEPGVLRMPQEMIEAACKRAHELGYPVAAHVESPEGVKAALRGGVDTIEHGALPDEETIQLYKETGAAHVATILPTLFFKEFDPAVNQMDEVAIYNGSMVHDGVVEMARACLENDIPVGLGTDSGCPYVTQYAMWRELVCFHKYCGVSNKFALYTGTKRNAEIAGVGDLIGTIEEGKRADFIITEKDPLEDLYALRDIEMVVTEGTVIQHPKIRKNKDIERELDKVLMDQ